MTRGKQSVKLDATSVLCVPSHIAALQNGLNAIANESENALISADYRPGFSFE